MKLNPSVFGGAILGGAVAGNTGQDGYEVLPTLVGGAVGGTAGGFLNLTLPSTIKDPLKVTPDYTKGVSSHRVGRSQYLDDVTELLTRYSKGISEDTAFDPTNPVASITETNLKQALRYYDKVGETELKKALLFMKEGSESFVKFNPESLNAGYTVNTTFSPKTDTVIERREALLDHLTVAETVNTPEASVSLEQEGNRLKRADEIEPLLKRLKGNVVMEDGVLRSTLNNQIFSLPLTQTLYDGSTLGHISNNNVYTSHNFNIMGAAIAQGLGSTEESAHAVLGQLGIEKGTTAYETGMEMLYKKNGVTREATLGFLASSSKVSDSALLTAIETLSDKKQWDEAATTQHLANRVAKVNGQSVEGVVPFNTRHQASLLDFQTTIKHSKGSFGDLSETALRGVRTSTDSNGNAAESAAIRRTIKALGEDRVSGVKADHSLLFTPSNNSLFNLNTPYNRNSGSITNRALAVSGSTPLNDDFKKIQGLFGAETQFSSAVALRTATLDEDVVAKAISTVFGGNVTLGDGYALGNKEAFNNFYHEGYQHIKLKAGIDNTVSVRQPLLNHLLEGKLDLETVKDLSKTHETFRVQNSETLRHAHINYARANKWLNSLKDSSNYSQISEVLGDTRHKNISKMFDGIYHSYEKELKNSQRPGETPKVFEEKELRARLSQGIEDYFGKRMFASNMKTSTEYADAILSEVNEGLRNANEVYRATGDLALYKETLEDPLRHLDNQKDLLRAARQTVNVRGGQTIGFGVDGSSQQLSKSFDEYTLEGIEQRVDNSGRVTAELMYKGRSNVGDNHVVKTHSVNYKDQNILLDKETYVKTGVLGDMITSGTLTQNSDNTFTLEGSQTPLHIKDVDHMLATGEGLTPEQEIEHHLSRRKYSQTSVIAGTKGAGYKASEDIIDEIVGKSTGESILSKSVKETIDSFSEAERKSKRVQSGLLDFVYASSNEKPSNTALAETILKTQESLRDHAASYKKGSINREEYLRRIGTLSGNSQAYGDALINLIQYNFDKRTTRLAESMSTAEGLFQLTSNAVARKEVAAIFVDNAKIRGSHVDNTHIGIVAMNRKAITETGAGTFEKSMSWNAQSQLLANGYSKDALDMFATFDKAATNDAQALSGMTRKHDTLLNAMFTENRSLINTVLGSSPEERRAILEGAFNYSTSNNVDFYNLHYKPTSGISSLPIIYDESRGFDSYVDSDGTGAKRTKRINKLVGDIIDTDIALSKTTDVTAVKDLRAELEAKHTQLSRAITPTLGGSSGVAKAALTRIGDASHLGVVGAVHGDLASFLEQEKGANRSTSYAGVSYHGALERLKLAGVTLDEDETQEFLSGKGKYLQDVDGFENLKRVVIGDTPLFGLVNREPAQGPMSIRGAEYMVDTSIYDSQGAKASIFMSTNDPIYKLLQFGDYDFDSMTEYFPKRAYADSSGMLSATIARSRQVSESYNKLLDFASKLGVKNNKTNDVKSLLDILEENPHLKTYDEWHKAYLDSVFDDSTKAGLRKTISPKVTMLASQLNNSLLLSSGELESKNVQAGRVLTHYFVENLLKAQHSSESAGQETVAERLTRLREQATKGNPSEYFDQLNKSLMEQLKNIKPSSDDYKIGQDAVEAIVKAERSHLTDAARNPMEIAGKIRGASLNDSLETVAEVLTGQGQSIKLNRTISETPELAEGLKVGYDRSKAVAKQFFNNNKKVLGLAAAGLAGTSLMFRDKPKEAYESQASADVGRHSLDPSKSQGNPVQGRSSPTSSEYITPHRDAKRAVTVEGDYVGDSDEASYNTRKSVFGDNIDSAQVEYRE